MNLSTQGVIKASAAVLLCWDLYLLYILVGSRISIVGLDLDGIVVWVEHMTFVPFIVGAVLGSLARSSAIKFWKSGKKKKVVFNWLRCPKCGWSRLSTSRAHLSNKRGMKESCE